MKSFRSFWVAFAGFISTTCIVILIWTLALLMSVFNESAVKQGLSDSGIYDSFMSELSKTLQTQTSTQTESILTSDALANALANTYSSDYIQSQTETIIDSTYNWANGTSSEISFTIPVNEQRDTLIQELATAIEPAISQLQTCTALNQASAQSSACLPSNMTSEEFAKSLATQAISGSDFASTPISSDSLNVNSASSPLAQLPQYFQILRWSTIILAALAVAAFAIMLIVSTEKIKTMALFGRRLFFGALIPLCFGAAMYWLGSQASGLPGLDSSTISMAAIVVPLMQKFLQLIGLQLIIFGGAFTAIGLAIWIGFKVWISKKNKETKEDKKAKADQPPAKPIANNDTPTAKQ